jgi:hypothetical protein
VRPAPLLVALVLVVARDQLLRAAAGFPVDLAQAVTGAILAQLVEFGAFATAAMLVRADHPAGAVGADQGEVADPGEVRVDA